MSAGFSMNSESMNLQGAFVSGGSSNILQRVGSWLYKISMNQSLDALMYGAARTKTKEQTRSHLLPSLHVLLKQQC